jgi:Protein involved in chromosome segregation, interacts with SMC proteins
MLAVDYFQYLVLFPANSCHSWPNVVGLLSWLVDVVRCVRHENFMNIMFNSEDEEEVPENFLDSKVLVTARFEFLSAVLLKTEV